MGYLLFLGGVIFGSIITQLLWLRKTSKGKLKIDHSDPEKDVYRFEIGDIDDLSKKKYIYLNIDHNADLSQR